MKYYFCYFFLSQICHFNKAQKHVFSPAHQARWNRLLHPYLLHGAQHDSHSGEFSYNSLRSLFNPFSFHFLSSARCPVEILSRHLIKVSSLFTEDISSIAPGVFSFFLPECANRVIKTAFAVLSGAASVSQVALVRSHVFSCSLNDPSVENNSLGSCSKPMLLRASRPYSSAFYPH